MDSFTKTHHYLLQSQPPTKTPTFFTSHLRTPHHHHTSFPIIAVAIIGILATAFLLISYYIFVIKCCLNWHRIDLLRRFSLSRNNRSHQNTLIAARSPSLENRGLDESVIRSIPIFKFDKHKQEESECAVCLNEFQEQENLRMIPNCGHVFHIDCIDVWLQSNSNCPLCRTSISIPSQMDQSANSQDITGDDQDYVVIELGRDQNEDQSSNQLPISTPSPRRLEQCIAKKKGRRFGHVSKGDECIDIRGRDEFSVQPMRRSFSLDSAADRKLYLAVQELAVEQSSHGSEISSSEDCSTRMRKSFFPFGHGRGSRSAVLPIHLEP
ncbi:hypothetical protein LguiB_025749 [Lonicera macranthoides]